VVEGSPRYKQSEPEFEFVRRRERERRRSPSPLSDSEREVRTVLQRPAVYSGYDSLSVESYTDHSSAGGVETRREYEKDENNAQTGTGDLPQAEAEKLMDQFLSTFISE
jgi:hypothetical protein